MKKRSFIPTAVLFSAAILFTSCKKDEAEDHSHNALDHATIVAGSPLDGAVYPLADTVWIDVDITNETEMHGFQVMVINVTAGDTVFEQHLHDHGMSFSVHDHWVNDVLDHSDMRLEVHAIIDHDGTEDLHSVEFHCHPM